MSYGINEIIEYTKSDGTLYARPLIKGIPKITFKNDNTPISISFQFHCPYEFCGCTTSIKTREAMKARGERIHECGLRRRIRFLDSCLICPASLASMIDDLHIAREKEHMSLDDMFPNTYAYARSLDFTYEQFQALTSSKMTMPFEFVGSFETLESTTQPPSPSDFASLLKGSEGLNDEDMAEFTRNWNLFGCRNLLQIYYIYGACDTLLLSDAMTFYLNKLHSITRLFASHFLTLSSCALASVFLNSRDPKDARKPLFLPFLSGDVYEKFQQCLVGGYSVNSCFYSHFNYGFHSDEESLEDEFVSTATYHDYNALYPRFVTNRME